MIADMIRSASQMLPGDPRREYIELIPESIRNLARYKTTLPIWISLETMWAEPEFHDFLKNEVEAVGVNYVEACWVLAKVDGGQGPGYRHALARTMMRANRQEVLTRLSGKPWNKSAIHLLMKSLVPARGRLEFLERLREVAANGTRHSFLAHAPVLNQAYLEALAALPSWLQRPNLMNVLARESAVAREIIPPAIFHAPAEKHGAIAKSLSSARTLGELERLVFRWVMDLPALPVGPAFRSERRRQTLQGGRLRQICSFTVSSDRPEQISPFMQENVAFPSPPFLGTDRLVPIRTSQELMAEGRRMQHCVGGFASDVLGGTAYFYRWLGEERATIQMNRVGQGWVLGQYKGHANRHLTWNTTLQVIKELLSGLGMLAYKTVAFNPKDEEPSEKVVRLLGDGALIELRLERTAEEKSNRIVAYAAPKHSLGWITEDDDKQLGALLRSGMSVKGKVRHSFRTLLEIEVFVMHDPTMNARKTVDRIGQENGRTSRKRVKAFSFP